MTQRKSKIILYTPKGINAIKKKEKSIGGGQKTTERHNVLREKIWLRAQNMVARPGATICKIEGGGGRGKKA